MISAHFHTFCVVLLASTLSYSFKITKCSVQRSGCRLGAGDSAESSSEGPRSMKESSVGSTVEVAKIIGALMATTVPAKAHAFSFFPSEAQKGVDAVASYQKNIYELVNMLKPNMVPNALGVYSMQQQLKGGKDDSDVVLLYNINYVIPLQKKMDEEWG